MSKEAKVKGNLDLLDQVNGHLFKAMSLLSVIELESEKEYWVLQEIGEQIQEILNRFDEIKSYQKYVEAI